MNQFDNFRVDFDKSNIAMVTFDQSGSSSNTLSGSTLEEFDQVLDFVTASNPAGMVIQSGKSSGFIAGANVKDFAKLNNEEQTKALIERAHTIFMHLESLPFPTVALIHGYCLGGGLELALACNYRIASNESVTKLGFPEVKLGIFPGFGGSVRSIKTLGHIKALQLMLGGYSVSSRTAKKIGLIDQAVPIRQMRSAAIAIIRHQPSVQTMPSWQTLFDFKPIRKLTAKYMAKEVTKKAQPAHYPAPFVLLAHWAKHAGAPSQMYKNEIKEVSRLINTDTAQNLIRVFMLQDKLKAQGNKTDFDVRRVHVVGGGIMGGDIAAWCALQGLQVSLQDREPAYLQQAMQRANKLFKQKLKDPYDYRNAQDRLMPDHRGVAVSKADVVIEAIFEDTDAKVSLYQELLPKMKPGAVLATNTSSIPLDVLSHHLDEPERLVGLHFFNPVAKMPLLEIVKDENTAPHEVTKALAFARHINKLPLVVNSSPGFLVNRVLMPYLLEAVELLQEGVSMSNVDAAAVNFGMPMGPIELADTVGLDICLSVAEKMAIALHNPVPKVLRAEVHAKRLGKKSGHGFYEWKNGKPIKPPLASHALSEQEIADRLIMRLINESMACLREGVVEDPDLLDAGIIFGTGFAPFTGGPMHYAEAQGLEAMRYRLHQLEDSYGDQFHADDGWIATG